MFNSTPVDSPATLEPAPAGTEVVYLGAGCFWCTEAVFQQLPGVLSVTSGYMGGATANPTYDQICSGNTGHAEVTRIVFEPAKLSLETLLQTFWKMHDPTTLNRQGNDVGTQYRSAIFYASDQQKQVAESSKQRAATGRSLPVVTEIVPESTFYPAENYHQDYYNLNKSRNSYCTFVITPKLDKLGMKS